MALGKSMGPGGRIARAEKKVEKAKDKVGKVVSKFSIASTDSPKEYFKKKENAAKGAAKVEKAVSKVDKAKANFAKVEGKIISTIKKRADRKADKK